MSSKPKSWNIFGDRDVDHEREKPATKSTKTKDREREKEKTKDKRGGSNRSSHGKKADTPTKDRDSAITATSTTDSSTSSTHTRTRRSSMPEADSAPRSEATSFLESRVSLPYPSFSKTHSKIALWEKNDNAKKAEIPTPDPTDVADGENRRGDGRKSSSRNGHRNAAPPSPPLTADQRSSRKGSSMGSKEHRTKDRDPKPKSRKEKDPSRSTSSIGKKVDEESTLSNSSPRSSTPVKVRLRESSTPHRSASHKNSRSTLQGSDTLKRNSSKSHTRSTVTNGTESTSEFTNDSDATSIAPNQPKPPSRMQSRSSNSHRTSRRHSPPIEVFVEEGSVINGDNFQSSPLPPPPPPPPPEMPVVPPRVDYLLQNGGLPYPLPKHLLGAGQSPNMPEQLVQPQTAIVEVFEPYNRMLDDFNHVMSKNGSLAVATGYRSVARRLLDRLEAVFARDISSEVCQCLMCEDEQPSEMSSPGVSWGEVLELVSGRRELPSWPPFHMTTSVNSQVLPGEEHIPMQKLDIDVPEEYREHYVRQSRKTKQAVDKWLLGQTDTSPPEEVDDETLTFAMMTHLDSEYREIFRALLGIRPSTPVPGTSTPAPRSRPDFLIASSIAIQRLYRLSAPARESETALYMLNNPYIHNVLATLAAISNDEWDILVSGRFDGFLRSGAEDNFNPSMTASAPPRTASRSGTPFRPGSSRGPTPFQMDPTFRPVSQPYGSSASIASYGAPIALDEETEIAALAEIERDIYLSMESLEDAFEALHCKAEVVRRALRERGAGLSVANQARRGSAGNLDARLGTPASMFGGPWDNSGIDEDDGIDDDMSLAPDDSASNISSNRRRRPKRRSERRTPAPVEEEDEEEDDYQVRRDRRR